MSVGPSLGLLRRAPSVLLSTGAINVDGSREDDYTTVALL